MAIPDFQSIMLPLLKLLGDQKERTNQQIAQELSKEFNLTPEEVKVLLPSGNQQIFVNRISWAKSFLKQALLIASPQKGIYQITSRGLEILEKKPERIDVKYLCQFHEFPHFRRKRNLQQETQSNEDSQDDKTPEEYIEYGYQRVLEELSTSLLEKIKECPPKFFEKLVIDLLLAMGYGGSRQEAGKIVGASGDAGVDGIINEDKLGLDSIYIQAKRWDTNVGRPEIQRFAGALQGKRARKGVFITTSSFTKDASDYVSMIDSKIILIDGEYLSKLMIEHNIGVAKIGSYELKKIDSDYFIDE
jgi:restriction system protein